MINKNKIVSVLKSGYFKIVLVVAILFTLVMGGTYAWWTVKEDVVQTISLGSLKVEADFPQVDDPINFEPGLETSLEGKISNTGSIPAIMRIKNLSEIKFAYVDDQLTGIPESERAFIDNTEDSVEVSFSPVNQSASDDIFWFKDHQNQLYILMEPGAAATVQTAIKFSDMIGNKYQESEVRVTNSVQATQVVEGAISSELGVSIDELQEVTSSQDNSGRRAKRSISRGTERLYQLLNRK
ncbi:hypothetical protein CBF34_10770 [Vagococcus penaei]|uniref:Uncharacterized protein n=1 Tax=Vagococcus penaei TaxID=633807 RepID=A0A1Q2D5H4_9ENTE|nr:TasA family protein [Vagococcus penaei]AQP53650.1 hypothetical protein BW732_04965 [Vagococcus penaei]RST98086.1 hypothetical protein CBF34_10770 [Vagococcus penaei]